ncbi:MAG: beta galactosidase jelly roll domain-containing protein [Alistipes sp.]|nr:beta galactosidase jelly roll domain-containing protein [Alistipes sp.]
MKKLLLTQLLLACSFVAFAQWSPAGDKIRTPWADQVDPANVLPEYPRPIMERDQWMNLNGLWDYSIAPVRSQAPENYEGKILVPFPVESSLSGVGRTVGENNVVWYEREFTVPANWKGQNILLHFGAVDWHATVWVNDYKVGEHKGGYTPFTFDITECLNAKGTQTVKVKVWDPTDHGPQPRGKQIHNPHGIWYTPVTGIWQTVWLEPVPSAHIASVNNVPNIDRSIVTIIPEVVGTDKGTVEVAVTFNGANVATGKSLVGQPVEIYIPDAKLWSPDAPNLYDIEVKLVSGNTTVDKVNSYFGMRKYTIKRDDSGIVRFQLNNENCFHFGPLDQGWWPDGLYTAPTDEALLYDIKKTKDFGYNMIRKHVKVEPARWYTHCDREGIIVWQDMPNGDRSPEWQMFQYFTGNEIVRSPQSEEIYRREWKEIMDYLMPYPCIGVWVPFNEAWGQFKTAEIVEWTKNYDPTRLVNPASGGNHYPVGDILDLHKYPSPELYMYDGQRATVLGEYGGIGLVLDDHLWETDRNWGYVQFKTKKEVTDTYVDYAEQLITLIPAGFSGAVYTQTTDVEMEVNGLLTYDRKEIKVEEDRIRAINQKVINTLK